jgi:hypothetical protein
VWEVRSVRRIVSFLVLYKAFTLFVLVTGCDECKWRKVDCSVEEGFGKSVLGVFGELSCMYMYPGRFDVAMAHVTAI